MSYDCIYVEYDALSAGPVPIGPKCVRCQCCGKEIVRRDYVEVEIKSEPVRREKVLTMVRLSNYRRVPMALSDGSVIHIHLCATCEVNEEIDFEKDEAKTLKIVNQIKSTFMNEDRFHVRPEEDVIENSKRWDKVKAVKSFRSDMPKATVFEKTRLAVESFRAKKQR